MKITTKTTKEQLKKFLGVNAKAVQKEDKDLFDRLSYTSNMAKKDDSKVTRKDLVDLAKEVIALLGNRCSEPAMTPVAENSVKKLTKGGSKKQEPKKDSSEEVVKSEEKTTKKKSATKKSEKVESAEEVSKKSIQLATMFPKTLSVDGNKYELASDIKNMDELYKAYEKEEVLVFAYYWTKRHLKQFAYFNDWLGHPESFENDLDLATAIHVSDEKKVAYQVSMYTEAIYTILPKDLEEEDGIRIASGIEFQIYRQVE